MDKGGKKWKGVVQDEQNILKYPQLSLVLCPAEKVMLIDLIRRKLFREFLSATDLLTCRLVCTKWTEDATSALLLPKFGRSLSVYFYYTTTGPNPNNYVNEATGRTLKEWLQSRPFFHNSIFPCTNFEFQNGTLEKNEDGLRFFMDVKSESKSESHRICSLLLAVWSCSQGTQIAPLLELLRPHVAHLKYLTLKQIHPKSWTHPSSWWYCPPDGPQEFKGSFVAAAQVEEMELKFGKVEFIALEEFRETLTNDALGFEMVRSVLNRAPNLKWVINQRSVNLKAIWLEKKVRTVHSWFFIPHAVEVNSPYWTDKPETFIFLEQQPTLKEFGIDVQRLGRPLSSQELQCVSLVLKKSQRSLEKILDILDLLQCTRMGLEIPRMENVTTVTQQRPPMSIPIEWIPNQNQNPGQRVNANEQAEHAVEMDRDFLTRVCPNVQHVVISDPRPWGTWGALDLVYPFAFDLCDPLTSVSKCSVHFPLSRSISALGSREINSIIRLCPNLTVIQLSFPGPRPLTFPQLFGRIIEHLKMVRTIAFHFHDSINHIKAKDDNDDGDPKKWMSKMDAVVSGFSPETCKKLALQPQSTKYCKNQEQEMADLSVIQNTNVYLDNEKPSSSILDLKDLICLRFKFDPKILRQSLPPFFSPVAFLYGFDILARRQYFYLECPKQFIHPNL